ncbi:alpha/beta hydrolase [Croceivirga sp. JEA036]|uniref:alpha/beta hydrolase n=1 Tax=Croceivirga sp. JEA036 TaxID=2721162 RepID=UPI00143975A9|nr:alpha/beta hydrolase [Croceivirga sp. JEA036]NJB37454.1 alpha/beta hydrolase [Croceivirga sp. JEA036]
MVKKYAALVIAVVISQMIMAQDIKLVKGKVMDSIVVNDSIAEDFSLYLPNVFEAKTTWPLLMVTDLKKNASQQLRQLAPIAESKGYILVAPNSLSSKAAIADNILEVKNALETVVNTLPINRSAIYVAGFGEGGRFASLVPVLIKDFKGVLGIHASLANVEVLSSKNNYHYVGLTSRENYNYTTVVEEEKLLNGYRIPNNFIFYDGADGELKMDDVARALSYFELLAMAKGYKTRDTAKAIAYYKKDEMAFRSEMSQQNYLMADRILQEMQTLYRPFMNVDSLKRLQRDLRKIGTYRSQKRQFESLRFNENLKREDFAYYLEEDVLTYNYNNLGWWLFKMNELDKQIQGQDKLERQMALRLKGYVNALADDQIDVLTLSDSPDEEALVITYMIKTIIEPENAQNYLNVVSISAKNEDYGTAIYYLEELLKIGYRDKQAIYNVEHTALLKIMPEFNALLEKYLGESRY